jgi:hypothetical protein
MYHTGYRSVGYYSYDDFDEDDVTVIDTGVRTCTVHVLYSSINDGWKN